MTSLIFGAVALNVYAAALILARALVYRTRLYRPMLWNIALSIAPAVVLLAAILSMAVTMRISALLGYAVLALLTVVWLLMLPNASYLITELNQSHRGEDDPVPLWYDIILVITLAMSGVVNTVLNLFAAHFIFALSFYGDRTSSFVQPLVLAALGGAMLLIAFGMYLGRYPRFNSWDVRHPASFAKKLVGHFSERDNLLAAFGFTLTYALFLALIYLIAAGPVIEGLFMLESR